MAGIKTTTKVARRRVVLVIGAKHSYFTQEFLAGKVYEVDASLADKLEVLKYKNDHYFAPASKAHDDLPLVQIASSAVIGAAIVDLGGEDAEVTQHLQGAVPADGTEGAASTDGGVTV